MENFPHIQFLFLIPYKNRTCVWAHYYFLVRFFCSHWGVKWHSFTDVLHRTLPGRTGYFMSLPAPGCFINLHCCCRCTISKGLLQKRVSNSVPFTHVYPLALQCSQDSIVLFLLAKPPAQQASNKGDGFADNRPITVSGPQRHLFRTITTESIFTILVSLEISYHGCRAL